MDDSTTGWLNVTKDEFYAAMGPLDVHPHARLNTLRDAMIVSDWEIRNTLRIVGISKCGCTKSEYLLRAP